MELEQRDDDERRAEQLASGVGRALERHLDATRDFQCLFGLGCRRRLDDVGVRSVTTAASRFVDEVPHDPRLGIERVHARLGERPRRRRAAPRECR